MLLMSQGMLSDEHGQQVIDFLIAHQRSDGGFATFRSEELLQTDTRIRIPSFEGWCSSHNSVTAAAIKALTTLGISWHSTTITRALDFLRRRQNEDGLWSDYWWQGPYYSTYHATDVLLQSPAGLSDSELDRICQIIVERQDPAGFWTCREDNSPCSFSTGLAINTLLLSPSMNFREAIKAGVEWLNTAQRDDGAWTSPPILQIPVPNVLVPDPINVNREPEVNFVFSTSTAYSALYNYSRWQTVDRNERAYKGSPQAVNRQHSIQPPAFVPAPNAETPRQRPLS
jgi:prenyltransferase beta subunit